MTLPHTDDLRIRAITPLSTPAEVMRDCHADELALDTVAQIETHMLTRSYQGFMRRGRLRGRRTN